MRYCGGKSRFCKEISKILLTLYTNNKLDGYIEPFCGGLSVLKQICPLIKNCEAYDINQDLIMLYKQIQKKKFKVPNFIKKDIYYEFKNSKKHSALRGYIGIVYSYAGGWYNTYYPVSTNGQDYISCSNKEINELMTSNLLKNVNFKHKDYKNIDISAINNKLIYCDPPYKSTLQRYTGHSQLNQFDHDNFWSFVRKLSKKNIVVVSETIAPDDFQCIWSKKIYVGVAPKSNQYRYEKLFVYNKLYSPV